MNYRLVSKYIAYFAFAAGVMQVVPLGLAMVYAEADAIRAFGLSIATASVFSFLLGAYGRSAPDTMFQREALALVSLSWFVAAIIGAFPYVYVGSMDFAGAFFESMSGFTTTGATAIQDIEAQPKSLLFWRSFTQWLGGVGIVVLFIAVLPYLGAGGKQLFRSESTGPDPRGLSPRIKDTASLLWRIYLGLTVIMIVALMLAGMDLYNAVNHTMTTMSTGGFSPKQASVGHFDSLAVELIIVFFMIAAGTSFALFFTMFTKDWKAPFKDTEWRGFIAILTFLTLVISVNLVYGTFANNDSLGVGEALRVSLFQSVSILTGTGFGTNDYDVWPPLSRMLIFISMFFGACAGSTAGGIKIVRIIMLAKIAYWRVENTFRPKTVRHVRISDNVIDDDTRKSVHAFFVIYIGWFVFGSMFMAALGLPFETAMGSVAATLNNVGPGLAMVGPTQDYSHISDIGKYFLSLCMVLGRLELFSICVLFVPGFWKHS